MTRRVETVRFVNATTLERRISYDLDASCLLKIAEASGHDKSRGLLLPVIVLRKNLLLDLDLLLPDGSSAQVVSSEVDSQAATQAMLALLKRNGVPVGGLPKAIPATILRAAASMPGSRDIRVLESNSAEEVETWRLVTDLSGDPTDAAKWAELLHGEREFYSMLANFTLSFMLMTPVDLSAAFQVCLSFRRRGEAGSCLNDAGQATRSSSYSIPDGCVPGIA